MELVILPLLGLGAAVVAGVFFLRRRGSKTSLPPVPVQSAPEPEPGPTPTPAQPPAETSPLEQAFSQSSDHPMYDLSVEGGSLSWNDAFYKVFGYDHSEQANTAEWWASHIHPDDAMVVNEEMDKLRDSSFSGWETSYRFKKADGNYAAVTDHVLIRRDKEGQAESLLGTMDIQADAAPPPKL